MRQRYARTIYASSISGIQIGAHTHTHTHTHSERESARARERALLAIAPTGGLGQAPDHTLRCLCLCVRVCMHAHVCVVLPMRGCAGTCVLVVCLYLSCRLVDLSLSPFQVPSCILECVLLLMCSLWLIYHCHPFRYHHHTAEEQSHAGEVFRKVHTALSRARARTLSHTRSDTRVWRQDCPHECAA
jgi:hypothetical protein